jgi:hypothetical protein
MAPFHLKSPLEGYRRLTFMMLDADTVAVSPSSVWRVLGQAGLLKKWNGKPSKQARGTGQKGGESEVTRRNAQSPTRPEALSRKRFASLMYRCTMALDLCLVVRMMDSSDTPLTAA